MGNPLDILIVEDSPDDALLLVRELETAGFDLQWRRVETEADFLRELQHRPDIILSDYSLPQFNGLRAAELVRQSGLDVPFILISGTVGEDVAVEAMKQGATDYLLKDRLVRLGSAIERARREAREHAERKRAEERLRESELKFRQLAENIREVFWMTEPEKNRMLYISPAYETIWGRTCQSLYDSPRTWLEAIHPDDRDRIQQAAISKQVAGTYDEEYRITRPDGTVRWIHDQAFPVRNPAGAVERVVGVAEDITERRKLEEQFRQAQKMEAIGQLAGGVAHDFNNILAIIQMQADLLAASHLPPEQHEGAREIAAAAQRAATLVRQLLLFGRKEVLQPEDLDLNQAVNRVAKWLQRILGEDIQMLFHLAPQPLFIHADAGMMDQVLMNLAVNSRDAMPRGGRLIIATSVETFDAPAAASSAPARPGTFVSLAVSDTGCGIPPENLSRIFEPFFTTKGVGKGTGLGLATVFGIVQQHHGWITVQSEPGRGTTFRIYLPATRAASPSESGPAAATRAPGGRETILLVEDEANVRHITRQILTRYGYKVVEAISGTAALEIWPRVKSETALVLTDMVMPDGVSGLELAKQLCADKPELRVIYTTGYSPDFMGKELGLCDGMNFLQKPFTANALAQTVREALDR